MKSRIRAEREKELRIATLIMIAVIIIGLSLFGFFIYSSLRPLQNQTTESNKAAIVDHLSLTYSNQTFVDTSTTILTKAGYSVDYYPGEKVTVEFYRNLPTHNYDMIILRVHSAAAAFEGKEFVECPVSFFTSENYSQTKYVWEQLSDQLVIASYTMPQPPYYFGITPKFVTSSMNGKFQNTTVIMMGCEGLNNTKMAEAFIEKGAKVYISWDGPVLGSHTDTATIHLLQNLITQRQPIRKAIENTMVEVGWDPEYNSVLQFYPRQAENYAVSVVANGLIVNTAETKKYDLG